MGPSFSIVGRNQNSFWHWEYFHFTVYVPFQALLGVYPVWARWKESPSLIVEQPLPESRPQRLDLVVFDALSKRLYTDWTLSFNT